MSFSKSIKNWSKETKKDARKVVSQVFIQLSSRIVQRTPFGNKALWDDSNSAPTSYEPGTLKNSWHAGIGDNIPSLKTRSPNLTGADSLSNIYGVAPNVAGQIAYLANPTAYARRIEYDGWSKRQAPAGMVRITLREFKQIVKKAVNVVN